VGLLPAGDGLIVHDFLNHVMQKFP